MKGGKKRMRMEKKGQAAMEFLMTYGWAILAAIIAIGVLAYFGVFSPGKFMPNACTLNAPIGCDEFKINSGVAGAATIQLAIRNGGGADMTISLIEITGCNAVGGSAPTTAAIADNAVVTETVTCIQAITAGTKVRGDVRVTYTKAGGTLSQVSSGILI